MDKETLKDYLNEVQLLQWHFSQEQLLHFMHAFDQAYDSHRYDIGYAGETKDK